MGSENTRLTLQNFDCCVLIERETGSKQNSKAVEKMKKICKQAGIKIPPNIYRCKMGVALEEAFDALLEKHELTQHSNSVDISLAAKRLQKERDLEGKPSKHTAEILLSQTLCRHR